MSDVTRILERARAGDLQAADELLPLVYDELRRLAAAKMAHEVPGQTLQPTALVHEAWLRLGGDSQPTWQNRAHFLGAAAEAMRRILIDKARSKARLKRGGGEPLEEIHESRIEMPAPADEILAVHAALDRLAAEDAVSAQVVKLRYFIGMSMPEVAEALGLAARTVDRHWSFARAWLREVIEEERLN